MNAFNFLIPAVALGLTFGCGGGSPFNPPNPSNGTLNLSIGSDSIPGFSSVVVSVKQVEWSNDGGTSWGTLNSNVRATYDLHQLQNGGSDKQATATSAPYGAMISNAMIPQSINKFRITWDTVNWASVNSTGDYVVTNSQVVGLLNMPQTTVIDVTTPIAITSNGTANVRIMINASQAVQYRGLDSNNRQQYSFQATGHAYDLSTCSKITGTLTTAASAALGSAAVALPNAEVYAETVVGGASIVRRSFTDATGAYTLDALPGGYIYYVVSQPAGLLNNMAYFAQASSPISLLANSSQAFNFVFPAAANVVGGISLAVSPASTSTQGTWAELSQGLLTPYSQTTQPVQVQTLIVASLPAATTGGQDTLAFPALPGGSQAIPNVYSLTVQRSTSGAAPISKTLPQLAVISTQTTTPATVTYP